MSGERSGTAAHRIRVAAPAGVVYAVLADTAKMPLYFSPSVHVERLAYDGEHERLRMWCLMDGQLKSWTTRRHLDPVTHRIEFQQERPALLPAPLNGVVSLRGLGPHDTALELQPTPHAALPALGEWLRSAAEVKKFSEHFSRLDDLVLTFEDSLRIHGPAELAYDLLYRAGHWPALLPHLAHATLSEDTPGVQRLTLKTLAQDGLHTTESVRICFPHAGRIVFKQTTCAPHLAAHIGEWSVTPDATGVTLTCWQSVVLREEHPATGPHPTGSGSALAGTRRRVRTALSRTSTALLAAAKQHAETAVRML